MASLLAKRNMDVDAGHAFMIKNIGSKGKQIVIDCKPYRLVHVSKEKTYALNIRAFSFQQLNYLKTRQLLVFKKNIYYIYLAFQNSKQSF